MYRWNHRVSINNKYDLCMNIIMTFCMRIHKISSSTATLMITLHFCLEFWIEKNGKCIFAKAFALYTRAFRVWNKSRCRPVTQDNFFKIRLSKSEISSKYYIRTLRGMWMWICYIICQNLRHKMTTQTMIFSTKVCTYMRYSHFLQRFPFNSESTRMIDLL